MSQERAFVPWVEPIAAAYRESRAEIVRLASSLPAEAWERPSPNPGWTYKDLLAHVAADTGKNVHSLLRTIIAKEPVDAALFERMDERNGRDVEERRGRSIAQLIDEFEEDGADFQRLLGRLTTEDEERTEAPLRRSVGETLRALSKHDALHLDQLRTALAPAAQRNV